MGIVAALVLAGELALAMYLSLVAWLMSAWMADDSWAARASDVDWTYAAAVRFAEFAFVGVVAGCAIWLLNRWLNTKAVLFPGEVPPAAGIIAGLAITISSGVGATQFLMEKPWM